MSAVWLASGSPRRRELLTWSGLKVEVHPSGVPEDREEGEEPVAWARRLAAAKAAHAQTDRVVVAADTVVHRGERVFDKPIDRGEAASHLRALAGGWHAVTTGVCVRRDTQQHLFHVTTEVRFRALTDGEIADYLATGEADDKAGAYGIQGRGGAFVAELRGSWTNVMGLPVEETLAAIREVVNTG